MNLIKSPLMELDEMQQRMEQALDAVPAPPVPLEGWQPPVDIWEDNHQLVLVMELPGVEQNEIDIQIEGQMLIIRGQRPLEEPPERRYQRIERAYGPFCRQFTLPDNVERGRVRASCEQGLLRIVLPKGSGAQPLHISIDPT